MIFCLQNGITPVWLAAENGNINAVKLLMHKGANITIADKVTSLVACNNIIIINNNFQDLAE